MTHCILLQGSKEAILETLLGRTTYIAHPKVRNDPLRPIAGFTDLRIGLRHLAGEKDPRIHQLSEIKGRDKVLIIDLYGWKPKRGWIAPDALQALHNSIINNDWNMIIYHNVSLEWVKDFIDEIITCEMIYDLSSPGRPKTRIQTTSLMKPEDGFVTPTTEY